MQLGSIHARRVDTGLGIIVPPHLIALIVEDLVANRTGQHVELGMRDIFRGKLSVFLRRRRGVTGTDNKLAPVANTMIYQALQETAGAVPALASKRRNRLSALLSVVQVHPRLNVVAIS